uniref:Uncharacterized protein n=1 Tax=Myoviridae sp. ctGBP5 TaxID=2825071 RepID=A0A8S5PCB4_9CAUD|nr:MAG TPA: hypothetical protein [Myoviridae sp. ctGBP5]
MSISILSFKHVSAYKIAPGQCTMPGVDTLEIKRGKQ